MTRHGKEGWTANGDEMAGGVLQRAILAASEIGKIKRRQKGEMLVALANMTTIEVNAKDAADEWLDQNGGKGFGAGR